MSEETTIATEPRDALKLKHPEPDISPEQPWQDDELDRKRLAERLTKLIRNEQEPFIISIDGQWGSGKTFLLKRWQRDLERDGFRAIYYNAWEDDFCDDPLLAIIGQLSEHFKESKFKKLARKAGQFAVQVIKQSVIAEASRLSGFNLGAVLSRLAGRDLLQAYLDQRESKDRLKEQLTQLSAAVAKETQRPLVFIIDELDRCRPTFAIELLERVKHIFDVPGLVFVFGVNRAEICKSLQSVYGEIDAGVYLRRFFDMEFGLPGVELQAFCTHIMNRFGLHEYFSGPSTKTGAKTSAADHRKLLETLPLLCAVLDLSLRDIAYSVSMLVLAIRNLEKGQYVFLWPLSLLIPLKLDNPTLYRRFIYGDCYASDVIDYIDSKLSFPIRDNRLDYELTAIEADLYFLETARMKDNGESTPREQLGLLEKRADLSHRHLLSKRTLEVGGDRAEHLLAWIDEDLLHSTSRNAISELARLIDFDDIVER